MIDMWEKKVKKNISWIKRSKLDETDKIYDVPKKNIELVLKYHKEMEVNNKKPTTRLIFLKNMRTFMSYVKKDFNKVTNDDVIRFFDKWRVKQGKKKPRKPALSSVNSMKYYLKSFFKWMYGTKEYPDCVKHLKIKQIKLELKGKLLDPDEIQKLLDVCDNSRDRALIHFLIETGVRLSELLSMKIGDFKVNKVGAKVTVTGKTGERTIPIVRSVPYLIEYLRSHPKREDKNYPFWFTYGRPQFRNYGKPLKYNSIRIILQKLKRRSGLKKRIYCHLLRHQSVTEKKRFLTEDYQRLFFGWTRRSIMPYRYGGTRYEDLEKKINQHEGLSNEVEEKEKKIKCERCGLFNPEIDFCMRCNYPLKPEKYIQLEEKRRELEERLERVEQLLKKQGL